MSLYSQMELNRTLPMIDLFDMLYASWNSHIVTLSLTFSRKGQYRHGMYESDGHHHGRGTRGRCVGNEYSVQ